MVKKVKALDIHTVNIKPISENFISQGNTGDSLAKVIL